MHVSKQYMQLLQNTPVSCRACGQMTPGREFQIRNSDGTVVTECEWRCPKCGSFVKKGVTKIIKPENKQ